MRTLIVGIGALGGTIATRAASAGMPVWLATRSAESARALRSSGLRVSGVGGTATAASIPVAGLEEYRGADKFDLILLCGSTWRLLQAGKSSGEAMKKRCPLRWRAGRTRNG